MLVAPLNIQILLYISLSIRFISVWHIYPDQPTDDLSSTVVLSICTVVLVVLVAKSFRMDYSHYDRPHNWTVHQFHFDRSIEQLLELPHHLHQILGQECHWMFHINIRMNRLHWLSAIERLVGSNEFFFFPKFSKVLLTFTSCFTLANLSAEATHIRIEIIIWNVRDREN